ncbi:MAG: hypothetical protein MZV65_40480 [Chromatiales bacterium]|nr:hypothetical protein [Chromatiales bacterium]
MHTTETYVPDATDRRQCRPARCPCRSRWPPVQNLPRGAVLGARDARRGSTCCRPRIDGADPPVAIEDGSETPGSDPGRGGRRHPRRQVRRSAIAVATSRPPT